MPVRRRKQSNAMLYTLIIFVGLFIASTTVAVIYYVKAEEQRNAAETSQNELKDYATKLERDDVGKDVGTRLSGESWLGTTIQHLDDMVTLIVGGVAEEKSAEVKVNNANSEAQKALELAGKYITISDPNTLGLIPIIKAITAELQSTIDLQLDTQKSLNERLAELKNINEANTQKEQAMLAEKEKLLQDVEQAKQDYKELQDLLRKSTEEQVRNLTAQVQELTTTNETLEDRLDLKEAELAEARKEMKLAKDQIAKIEPGPDQEVLAYQPDGKIILVDNEAKTVHINIGSIHHVYPGLTFQVYDRGTTVKAHGIGKAEIQVFNVEKNYSMARILPAKNYQVSIRDLHQEFTDPEEIALIMLTLEKPYNERMKDFEEKFAKGSPNRLRILTNISDAHEQRMNKSPIITDDIIANLIWDSTRINVFAIAGNFDLDGDGENDYNAIERIKALIEKWGGRVDDNITIDTDFLILGQKPMITGRPTLEEQQQDPTALQKYEAILQSLDQYNTTQERAQALWIPILTYDKFLYFIGYKTTSSQAGAF